MNIKPRIVFFSIQTPNTSNSEYALGVEAGLTQFGFKKVLGSYKGSLENSYMVLCNEDKALEYVQSVANDFKQESILIVDENRVAYIDFLDCPDKPVKLGDFVSITALEAQSLENWTLDGTNYYSVK